MLTTNPTSSYEFFNRIGSPKYILAPMVDQSELAWRELGRRYGVQLAYTPMFHAKNFVDDPTYRKNSIEISNTDRPLIYQFCANDPKTFADAAKLVEGLCDAIDLNLGCPQSIAKRGHYGSYLQDEWDLIKDILTECIKTVKVPVTAKIRILSSIEKTIEYAQMLESCGISMLVVHGRLREQKGINTGLADWKAIRAVKEALKIPVIANGNILYYDDVLRCLNETNVDGVMSAEGHLHNPGIFSGSIKYSVYSMAIEYLEIVQSNPCPLSYSRGHIFKLLHHALHCHPEYREKIGTAKNAQELLIEVKNMLKDCKEEQCQISNSYTEDIKLPHWICQPYIRPVNKTDDSEKSNELENISRNLEEDPNIYNHTSLADNMQEQRIEERRKRKEARRICKENKLKKAVKKKHICEHCCINTKSLKCSYDLCKNCCRMKLEIPDYYCPSHKVVNRDMIEVFVH